jgi:hypothetical protein
MIAIDTDEKLNWLVNGSWPTKAVQLKLAN